MQVVEYLKAYEGEVPFMMNGEKWEYCWGVYPDGKSDIAVYRYRTDLAYNYNDFREAFNLNNQRPVVPESAGTSRD